MGHGVFYIFFSKHHGRKITKSKNGEIVRKGKKKIDWTLKELVYITEIHEAGEKDENLDQNSDIILGSLRRTYYITLVHQECT